MSAEDSNVEEVRILMILNLSWTMNLVAGLYHLRDHFIHQAVDYEADEQPTTAADEVVEEMTAAGEEPAADSISVEAAQIEANFPALFCLVIQQLPMLTYPYQSADVEKPICYLRVRQW